MNWYRAKTILIVFFVITNIFLLYNIIFTGRGDTYIKDEIILYTADILKKNGIEMGTDIPKKKKSIRQFNANNIVTDYGEFAKSVLGESFTQTGENEYKSDVGELSFSGDRFLLKLNSYKIGKPSKNKTDTAKNCLKAFKIDISDYVAEETDDGACFKQEIDGMQVFNSELWVKFSGDKLGEISGVWFEKSSDIADASEMKPITSVLIDILSSPECPKENTKITDLTLGYMVYDTESYHKSIMPMPVWKISFGKDDFIYMDARGN